MTQVFFFAALLNENASVFAAVLWHLLGHLAAENEVPKFALNWHGRLRNVDLSVYVLTSQDFKFGRCSLDDVKQICENRTRSCGSVNNNS